MITNADQCYDTSSTITELLSGFCKAFKYNSFLEIGTYRGYTSCSIHELFRKEREKSVVHTVDSVVHNEKLVEYMGEGIHVFRFFKMAANEYFLTCKEKFDVVLVDGDHSYEVVKKDFENSLNVLNKNGIICLHDPVSSQGVCRFFVEHIQNNPTFNYLIFPFHVGYVLIQRNKSDVWNSFLQRHPDGHVHAKKFVEV